MKYDVCISYKDGSLLWEKTDYPWGFLANYISNTKFGAISVEIFDSDGALIINKNL